MASGTNINLNALRRADFLTRSSFAVTAIACLIMLVFGVNNFIQGRVLGGITALLVSASFGANAVITARGSYPLYLNLFGIVPAMTIASITALISLQITGSYWPYVCVFGIYYILPFYYAKLANLAYLALVLTVAWIYLEQAIAIRFCTVLVAISMFIYIFSREIEETHAFLKKQATTDALTGVLNRTILAESLMQAAEQFRQNGTLSTVCLIDIDHFKTINDRYGHDAGDEVLITLASEITKLLAAKDALFRVGGEEFLILLKNTDLSEGKKTADEIRGIVQGLPLLDDHAVTVSIGVTEVEASFDWKAWMKVSDEKLYLAKDLGRNQVVG